MFFTMGRWFPSFNRGNKPPVVFYICFGDQAAANSARIRMEHFGITHFVTGEFADLETARQYAKDQFTLTDFEFSPFPITDTQP
jgi:hypothetical protein